MAMILDGSNGLTTPGVVNTAGETIATTLAVTGASTLTGAVTASTTLAVTGVSTFAAGTALLPALTTTGDTNTGLWFPAADTVAASTGGTERMRIDSSGNLLVGTTSATPNPGTVIVPGFNSQIYSGHSTASGSGQYYAAFGYNGGVIGGITQNGTTAVAYNTTSDYRLKENIKPLSGALARVAALKPCTYTWKSAPDEVGEGFIAHELAEVCSQATTGEKDAVENYIDEEGNEQTRIKPQGIDTSFLVATLTAAIQEQQALITQLQADVATLKALSA